MVFRNGVLRSFLGADHFIFFSRPLVLLACHGRSAEHKRRPTRRTVL